jgi:hypothetical protein
MARVPDDEIDQLQKRVSIERMAEARGVKLDRHGDRLHGECPFHESGDHAIVIDSKANTWACPGCGVTDGSVVELTMKAEGVSRRHAVELLQADRVGGGGIGKIVKNSTSLKLPDLVGADVDDAGLLAQIVAYYHESLKRTPMAMAVLKKYGVNAEAVERFRIGVSDRSLGYRLPKANRTAGAEIRSRLQRLGVLRDTGHESLRGCITVPLFDEHGAVSSIYGWRLNSRLLESPDAYVSANAIFNIETFTASREIVVCSSVLDAVIVWCTGVRHVTAVHERNLDALVAAIVKHGVVKVTICFPRTDDGEAKTEKFRETLSAADVEVFRGLLPSGMNVKSFVASSASAPEALATLVRQAEWIGGVRPSIPSPASSVTDPATTTTPTAATIATTPTTTSTAATATTATIATTPPNTGDLNINLGDRRWRIRGLQNNLSYEKLRVHLFVSRETKDSRTSGFFVDTIELYSARQRNAFVEQASEELGLDPDVVKRDLGHVLLQLEALQDEQIQAALKPKTPVPTMTDAEREAASEMLCDSKLIERILADFDRLGVVGESSNKLIAYLAALSRMLSDPLAVLVQSSSASGKTSLVDAVLAFVPEEDRVEYSAMTGQALYYVEPDALRNKVLAIAEEAGAQRAAYALKLLQSEHSLTIASTAKEAGTGRLVTHSYRVDGPVALMMTTTATEIDDELLNRCIVLSINEGREQTRAIHQRQRDAETLEGILARQRREAILQLHRNAQRLLRPILIVNPLAPGLAFQDGSTRARRDHRKYLTLIRTIALLHQHQRDVKRVEHEGGIVEYIEVVPDDITMADRLMADALGTIGELPPHTQHVLGLLDRMVMTVCEERGLARADYRFTRREARERLEIGGTQLWLHLRRLVEAEYVVVHPSRHGRGVVYELAVAGVGADRTSPIVRGVEGGNSGDVRPSFGPDSGNIRGVQTSASPEETSSIDASRSGSPGSRHRSPAVTLNRTPSADGAG